jgi:UDP-N-acetyl-D-galactosamine dehydrogenase
MRYAPTYDCLYERLVSREDKLALIGLGYVGMPISVEFAKHPSLKEQDFLGLRSGGRIEHFDPWKSLKIKRS